MSETLTESCCDPASIGVDRRLGGGQRRVRRTAARDVGAGVVDLADGAELHTGRVRELLRVRDRLLHGLLAWAISERELVSSIDSDMPLNVIVVADRGRAAASMTSPAFASPCSVTVTEFDTL